jgi:hypothetical protein
VVPLGDARDIRRAAPPAPHDSARRLVCIARG